MLGQRRRLWVNIEYIESGLMFMHSSMSMPPTGKTPTAKLFFLRRMPIDVRVEATYDSYRPNSFLVCLSMQLV